MTEKSNKGKSKENKNPKNKEKFDKLRKEIKESKGQKSIKNAEEAQELIATREKIERDYKEDKMAVVFYTSPETKRKVLARRPTNKEMITILRLSAEASKYEGSSDPESLLNMIEIYQQLGGIASTLSVDKNLDEDFWNEKVSFPSLQNFITELISISQEVDGGVTSDDMENFR